MSDDPDAKPKSRRWYKLCVTLGVVGVTIGVCSGLFWLTVPFVRDSAARLQCRGNLAQIAVATHGYNDANTLMPGPFHDDNGRLTDIPADNTDRLSWRVTLLPFIESDPTYSQVNKSEAWNSPTNRPLLNRPWKMYADPLDYPTKYTPYRVFYDNGALWDSDPKKRIPLDRIPDGASNTLLVVESTVKVPWAQFDEHRYNPDGPLPPLGRADRNSFLAAMADGSVRVVKKSVSPNTLRATITRAGGDAVGADW